METKISVLVITKNDADVIGDCIKSVKDFADEVIVVDGGSTDETFEIAKKLGARVVENEFKDFADQRNLAATFAHNEWIFYIDSDERATKEFVEELKNKIELAAKDVAGFYVKRKTYYFGQDWHFEDQLQRVFRKDKLKKWHGVVHETPEVEGRLETINSPIEHFTHRNFEQMVAKTNEWSDYEAELRLKSRHPKMTLWRFPRVMISAFSDSYFRGGGWKNGQAGVIEAIYQSFSMFITYGKLWEKQEKKN